jgi:hypothetical protein
MNLHYGCGLMEAPGWHNCDASPTVWLQRLPAVGLVFRKYLRPRFPAGVQYGDIVRGLSIPSDSCDAIYCCHVLEHLALEDLRLALRNTRDYLKAEGTFRLVLPDFEQQVAAYLASSEPAAISEFMSYTFLGRKTRPKGIKMWLREYFGNSHHLWMWDYKGLAHELAEAGFRGMRRCKCGDASNPAFSAVENPERFEWALAIECTK